MLLPCLENWRYEIVIRQVATLFALAYAYVNIWSAVRRAAPARLRDVSDSIVQVASVGCHLIAQELGW